MSCVHGVPLEDSISTVDQKGGLMAKQSSGKSAKGRQHTRHQQKYLRQFGRTAKNKTKAWTKHLKSHPKDEKAKHDIGVAKDTPRH